MCVYLDATLTYVKKAMFQGIEAEGSAKEKIILKIEFRQRMDR
jgi:hypothetical protein